MTGIIKFIKQYGIYVILVLAAVVRFAGLRYVFYGPYGELYRDLNVVYDLVKLHIWPLLGPSASVGGFYFGPVYYYLIAPFTWTFGLAPLGANFTSALFSVLEVFVFYKLLCLWFPQEKNNAVSPVNQTAILGTLLLAVSLYDIQNAYYISNPTLLPFFLVLFFYCLTLVLRGVSYWPAVAGLGVSFFTAIQLHVTALLLLPLVLAVVLAIRRLGFRIKKIALFFFTAVILWFPYFVYEFKNNFENFRSIFHTGAGSYGPLPNPDSIVSLLGFLDRALIYNSDLYNFLFIHPKVYVALLPLELLVLGSLLLLFRKRKEWRNGVIISDEGRLLVLTWLAVGGFVFLFYQRPLQYFYFLVLWPLPVLFITWFLAWLRRGSRRMFLIALTAYLLLQIIQIPFFFKAAENRKFDYRQLQTLFVLINKDAGDAKYNLIDVSYDPNLFGYYLRLFDMKKKLAHTGAERLYYISEAGAKDSPVEPAGYLKTESFFQGGIIATKYIKIKN